MISRLSFAAAVGLLVLSGCSSGEPVDKSKPDPVDNNVTAGGLFDQSQLCVANDDAEASKCTPGQLIFFRPTRWGNEQLPLTVAALYCDFSHQIVQNNGGVVCVFTDKRLHVLGSGE